MNTISSEVPDLLSTLKARGCRFRQVGENLRIRGAKLSEEELQTIREHKTCILQTISIGTHEVRKIGSVTWLFAVYPYQQRGIAYRLSGPAEEMPENRSVFEQLEPIPS